MHFSLTFYSPHRASRVRPYLVEPEKFVAVHPLIYRIEPRVAPHVKIYERVTLGFLAHRFTYRATIEVVDGQVQIRARVMGMVRIAMTFSFVEESSGTRITEAVDITTLLPVKRFMRWLIREQHAILFANINRAMAVDA